MASQLNNFIYYDPQTSPPEASPYRQHDFFVKQMQFFVDHAIPVTQQQLDEPASKPLEHCHNHDSSTASISSVMTNQNSEDIVAFQKLRHDRKPYDLRQRCSHFIALGEDTESIADPRFVPVDDQVRVGCLDGGLLKRANQRPQLAAQSVCRMVNLAGQQIEFYDCLEHPIFVIDSESLRQAISAEKGQSRSSSYVSQEDESRADHEDGKKLTTIDLSECVHVSDSESEE